MFIIFDLDGTLALNEHRQHFLDGETKDWDAFYAACVDDRPNAPIIKTLKLFVEQDHRVEIWSGRSSAVQRQTVEWLSKYGIEDYGAMRMRRADDYTPDDKLKLSWLEGSIWRPDLVFDDRDKVVAMWRAQGIVCCQVAPGAF